MFPFYSIESGPGENQRSYKCQVTGTLYSYEKGSSTDGADEKAVAMAALRAGQAARVTALRGSGHLANKPLETYELRELIAAEAAAAA